MKKFLLIFVTIFMLFILIPVVKANTQVKAYRNINFGDNVSKVFAKIKKDPEITDIMEDMNYILVEEVLETTKNEVGYVMLIGDTEINGIDCTYYFTFDNNDSLSRITFEGNQYDLEYFWTKLKDERNIFVDTITNNYGKTSWTKELGISDMKTNYYTWSHTWQKTTPIGFKVIKVGLGASDYKYQAVLQITFLDIN